MNKLLRLGLAGLLAFYLVTLSIGGETAERFIRGSVLGLVAAAIDTLNTLTDTVQTFSVVTTGTDFAITSAGGNHQFALPSASTTARGVVTTTAQTLGGKKTFTPTATDEGINVGGYTGDPSAAVNGGLWYDSTTSRVRLREGGTNKNVVADDVNVSVTASDTTPGKLRTKLVDGTEVKYTVQSPGGNETLLPTIGSWTKTIPFVAGAWSATGCDNATEATLDAAQLKPKVWYVQNCTANAELHFTTQVASNVDCSIPPRARLHAVSKSSTAGDWGTVNTATNVFYYSPGAVIPDVKNVTTNEDPQTITLSAQFMLANMRTNPLTINGSCAARANVTLRVRILGTGTANLSQVAFGIGNFSSNRTGLDEDTD